MNRTRQETGGRTARSNQETKFETQIYMFEFLENFVREEVRSDRVSLKPYADVCRAAFLTQNRVRYDGMGELATATSRLYRRRSK